MGTQLNRARSPRPNTPAALTLALALALGTPAWAAGEGGAPTTQKVEFGSLPLPMIIDGRLVNYVFVVLRLTMRPGADATRVKQREPYVRDSLLRVAHAQPFVVAGDATRIDERRLVALVSAEADRLIGRGLVAKVEVASRTPQHRTGLGSPPPPRTIIP